MYNLLQNYNSKRLGISIIYLNHVFFTTLVLCRIPILNHGNLNDMSKINLVNEDSSGSVQEKLKAIMNFDKIINSSLDSLWIADENGKILQVNKVGLKLYNLSLDDVINKKVDELLEKGVFDRSIIREVIRTEKSPLVLNKLKNGEQLLRVANPIFNSGLSGLDAYNPYFLIFLDNVE